MNIISGIDVTASALTAQKTRLDIVAQNIANAQTTRGPDSIDARLGTSRGGGFTLLDLLDAM